MNSWKLQWMTQHQQYEATIDEFFTCFQPLWPIMPNTGYSIPDEQRLHLQNLATSKMLSILRKPNALEEEMNLPLTVPEMSYQARTMYHILVKTLAAQRGPHKDLEGVMRNLLLLVCGYMMFDVQDFFMRTILHAAESPLQQKPYAP